MTGSKEALADAFSGVVGTLVSLWCFYPIERIKTNLQAGKSLSSSSGWSSASGRETSEKDPEFIRKQFRIFYELVKQSFRGCLTKSMHATSSSFCYFYFYSWIVSFHNNKRRRKLRRGHNHADQQSLALAPLQPSTRLILSAIAAMLNTFVTLPLDVLSSRRTVEDGDQKKEMITTTLRDNPEIKNKTVMETAWKSIEEKGGKSTPALTASTSPSSSSSTSSSRSTVEIVFHETCSCSEDLYSLEKENGSPNNDRSISEYSNSTSGSASILSNNEEYRIEQQQENKSRRLQRKRQLHQMPLLDKNCLNDSTATINVANITTNTPMTTARGVLAYIRRWSKLWKGLAPALLLCSNPSIHYTVFDILKSKTIARKKQRNRQGSRGYQLSVSEAFVLGLLAKFVATIMTYPLIRAKVLMMVRGDNPIPTAKVANGNDSNHFSDASTVSSPTLLSVLKESYHRDGGVIGLYKGCNWQLIHTLLKSALMMAIREQITDSSRALFGVSK